MWDTVAMQKKSEVSSKMISRAAMDTIVSEFRAGLAAWKKGNQMKTARQDHPERRLYVMRAESCSGPEL